MNTVGAAATSARSHDTVTAEATNELTFERDESVGQVIVKDLQQRYLAEITK